MEGVTCPPWTIIFRNSRHRRYLFGQAVESSDPRMRWSAQPPHLLPLLLFTAVLNLVQHGLSERLPSAVNVPSCGDDGGSDQRLRVRLQSFRSGRSQMSFLGLSYSLSRS